MNRLVVNGRKLTKRNLKAKSCPGKIDWTGLLLNSGQGDNIPRVVR
jgi:hypothetical protein